MILITCSLRFPDGNLAKAEIKADSPDGLYNVQWTGELGRIPPAMLFDKTLPDVLKTHCRMIAEETGAKYEEKIEGQYESWAH